MVLVLGNTINYCSLTIIRLFPTPKKHAGVLRVTKRLKPLVGKKSSLVPYTLIVIVECGFKRSSEEQDFLLSSIVRDIFAWYVAC